jgi:hypothetical protein
MRDFRNLQVWKKAHSLTLDVYKATASLPKDELYGLTSQLRRSSASIPNENVTEVKRMLTGFIKSLKK